MLKKKGKAVTAEPKVQTKREIYLNRLAIVLIMLVLAYSMAVQSGMIACGF